MSALWALTTPIQRVLIVCSFAGKVCVVQKEKAIDINHTQEGISHGHKPAGQEEGEQREEKERRGKK
jgi:hypothetical protein